MNGVQVRNLYYVKRIEKADPSDPEVGTLPGDLEIVTFGGPSPKSNKLSEKTGIQLKYVNPDGDVIVSDFIVKDQILRLAAVAGQGKALKKAVLALESAPIAGEDYIVDILVHNYQTISDNSTLTKFGAVHATTGMSYQKFMFKLAKSFALNFRRDEAINKFFTFQIGQHGSTFTPITFDMSWDAYLAATTTTEDTSNVYELEILEVDQPTWIRGLFPKQTVNFDVAPHTVIENGDEVQPFATVEESGLVEIEETATVINNGYDMADLEYRCHGEIGDQIRGVGYPRVIMTKYAIPDADASKMFDAVEIVLYYVGRNTSSQKAEKQITLAVEHGGAVAAADLLDEIEDALGTI